MATTEERRYALLHRCLRPTGGCAQISELLLRWTDIYSFRGEVTLPVERVTFYGVTTSEEWQVFQWRGNFFGGVTTSAEG